MSKTAFDKIAEGLAEASEIASGTKQPARHEVEPMSGGSPYLGAAPRSVVETALQVCVESLQLIAEPASPETKGERLMRELAEETLLMVEALCPEMVKP